MSERYEENTGEQWDDESHLDAIDQEWANLNRRLDEKKARQEEQADQQAEYNIARDEVLRLFRQSEIIRVFDPEDTEYSQFFEVFSDYYRQSVIEATEDAGEPLDEAFERQLSINTVIKYYEEFELQHTILTLIMTLRYLATAPSLSNASHIYAMISKKQLQADMLVHHNFNMDGVWQRFVDEMIPVEGLDIMNDYDLYYIGVAQQNLYEYHLEKQHNQRVLDGLKMLVGHDENGEIGEVVKELAALIIMRDEAARPIYSEEQRSNRNAGLWEGARVMCLKDEVAKKVVDFLDEQYPIVY